jgi:hypothetical protein
MEFLPKVTGEFAVAIRDDCRWHSMMAEDIVEKLASNVGGGSGGGAGNEVDMLG